MPLGLRSKLSCTILAILPSGIARRAEGIDEHRNRLRYADHVGELHLAALRQFRRHDVFCHVARHVRRAAVDLGGIFAGKCAAAVAAHAAVRIDDDFSAGETAIALRSADDESPGRIDMKNGIFVEIVGGNHRFDDAVDDGFLELAVVDVGAVLGGDHDVFDLHGFAVAVLHSHL